MKYIKNNWQELFGVCFLILAGVKLTHGLENLLDIQLQDETGYLGMGLNYFTSGVSAPNLGPLYSLWYYMLSFICPSRIALFYLNFKILTIAIPVLIFLFLRRYRVPILVSMIVSSYFLVFQGNLPVYPKPMHFCIMVALIFFHMAALFESASVSTLVMILGALACSYIRPEFFLAFMILTVVYFILLIVKRRTLTIARELKYFGITVVLAATTLLALGIPFSGVGSNRSFVAFAQHFTANWLSWQKSDQSACPNSGRIVRENFGNAQTVFQAFYNAPFLFMRHVGYNCYLIPRNAPKIFSLHPSVSFPSGSSISYHLRLEGLFVLITFFLIVFFADSLSIAEFKWSSPRNPIFLLHLSPFILTGLISMIVIYPRDHYLLFPAVFGVLAVLLWPRVWWIKDDEISTRMFLLAAFLILAVMPRLCVFSKIMKPNTVTINFLNSLKPVGPMTMLEAEGGFNVYLKDKYVAVPEYEKDMPFAGFMDKRKIDMIVLTDSLGNSPLFIGDPEWAAFLRNYKTQGFEDMQIPGLNTKIIFRKGAFALN